MDHSKLRYEVKLLKEALEQVVLDLTGLEAMLRVARELPGLDWAEPTIWAGRLGEIETDMRRVHLCYREFRQVADPES